MQNRGSVLFTKTSVYELDVRVVAGVPAELAESFWRRLKTEDEGVREFIPKIQSRLAEMRTSVNHAVKISAKDQLHVPDKVVPDTHSTPQLKTGSFIAAHGEHPLQSAFRSSDRRIYCSHSSSGQAGAC